MLYHMIVLSLPRKNLYLCLHKHEKADRCSWTKADRDTLFRVREQILALYQQGPVASRLSRAEVDLLHDSALTPLQAYNRVLPYYATADLANEKNTNYIDGEASDLEVIGPAGTSDDPAGVLLIPIAKGARDLQLSAGALYSAGNPDISTTEGRAERRLSEVIAWWEGPCTLAGEVKILAIPSERAVQLSRTRAGEAVAEVPEMWE